MNEKARFRLFAECKPIICLCLKSILSWMMYEGILLWKKYDFGCEFGINMNHGIIFSVCRISTLANLSFWNCVAKLIQSCRRYKTNILMHEFYILVIIIITWILLNVNEFFFLRKKAINKSISKNTVLFPFQFNCTMRFFRICCRQLTLRDRISIWNTTKAIQEQMSVGNHSAKR